jgi:hypothetical protein
MKSVNHQITRVVCAYFTLFVSFRFPIHNYENLYSAFGRAARLFAWTLFIQGNTTRKVANV